MTAAWKAIAAVTLIFWSGFGMGLLWAVARG